MRAAASVISPAMFKLPATVPSVSDVPRRRKSLLLATVKSRMRLKTILPSRSTFWPEICSEPKPAADRLCVTESLASPTDT